MNQEKLALFKSLRILFVRLIKRRVHFLKIHVGKILLREDGREFRVFRHLIIDPLDGSEESAAVFKVCFKFSGLSLRVNKRLSAFPVPFLIAKAGFRQKIWTVTRDGYFQGIYQWASEESAVEYPKSFIFKMMTKRAAEGTLSYEMIPDMILAEFVETQKIKGENHENQTLSI